MQHDKAEFEIFEKMVEEDQNRHLFFQGLYKREQQKKKQQNNKGTSQVQETAWRAKSMSKSIRKQVCYSHIYLSPYTLHRGALLFPAFSPFLTPQSPRMRLLWKCVHLYSGHTMRILGAAHSKVLCSCKVCSIHPKVESQNSRTGFCEAKRGSIPLYRTP